MTSNTSRRAVLTFAGAAPLGLALSRIGPPATAMAARPPAPGPIEPGAGAWATWALATGDQLRPPPPPDKRATRAELDELRALAAGRDGAALDQIAYWDAGAPGYRWNELACAAGRLTLNGVRNYRVLALLNVAIHDATIAAWDAKYVYNRPRPAEFDPALSTTLPTPASPSYPSEHAAAAGAAAAVLAHLFPAEAGAFAAKADEAAHSRLLAGVQYPSDVAAGLALGLAVGDLVVERAKADGSDAPWTGTVPTGPGLWQGANPAEPLAGTWKTWALSSGDQLRPGPPPAYDSAQMAAELAELKAHDRAATLNRVGVFWAHDPAGRPAAGPVSTAQAAFHWAPFNSLIWSAELAQKLFERRLDANPPRAARAYALVSIAGYDATVACWDAKYAYWAARPVHLDPAVTPLFPTPAHPSYPSGHSAVVGATSTVLGALFPRDAECFRRNAEEMAASRLWAGIHFRSDNEAGLALGRRVAEAVLARASADGSV
jgi:membrane-associated phospholipid phosphatase